MNEYATVSINQIILKWWQEHENNSTCIVMVSSKCEKLVAVALPVLLLNNALCGVILLAEVGLTK